MAAPPGFADALARKYDIQQQETDARTGLENAQAGVIPGDAAARQALERAQAFQTTETGKTIAPVAEQQIRSSQANVGEAQARTQYTGILGQVALDPLQPANSALLGQLGASLGYKPTGPGSPNQGGLGSGGRPLPGGGPVTFSDGTKNNVIGGAPKGLFSDNGQIQLFAAGTANVQPLPPAPKPGPGQTITNGSWDTSQVSNPSTGQNQNLRKALGYSEGTTKVPGKGDGTVDKVPAKLAPGEAVLNKGAAEALGRDLIASLNAAGMQAMGMNGGKMAMKSAGSVDDRVKSAAQKMMQGKPATKGSEGLKTGTPKVKAGGKSAPNTPPKGLNPSSLVAALGMMGKGAGMPAAGPAPGPMASPGAMLTGGNPAPPPMKGKPPMGRGRGMGMV